MTNKEEFCVSCHTVDTNLGEYRETIHCNNHSGARAICSDCHVPKEWNHKVKAKIMAIEDVYHETIGSISTPEKYEDRRLHMAVSVWTRMKQPDGRACRNCHNFDDMGFTIQETRTASEHQRAIDTGMTYIDCDQGIAQKLPNGHLETYNEMLESIGTTPDASAESVMLNTCDTEQYLDGAQLIHKGISCLNNLEPLAEIS